MGILFLACCSSHSLWHIVPALPAPDSVDGNSSKLRLIPCASCGLEWPRINELARAFEHSICGCYMFVYSQTYTNVTPASMCGRECHTGSTVHAGQCIVGEV